MAMVDLDFSKVKFVILLLLPTQVQSSGFELNKTHDFNEYFSVADLVKFRDLLKLPNTNVQFRATENYNIKSCKTNKELQKL